MADAKQMIDMRSSTQSISTKESNEQQRNWTEGHWQLKAGDPLSNYDPSRRHLDFEVTKGGVIQPIDTSRTIDQRLRDNLESRGIKHPLDRKDLRQSRRILAQFVCGGDRTRMRELAFGDQVVDFGKKADNSHIVRKPEIEQWARDVYNYVAKRYGEENIVSCYVHLDEMSPHLHLTLVPVKDGRLSYRDVFGKNKREESLNMTDLHTTFALEVGNKWGLERGSNMEETKAKHRSTEEYKRDLIRQVEGLEKREKSLQEQIRDAERKIKSFTTMIANLEKQKLQIQTEIDEIAKLFGQEGANTEELAKRMRQLRLDLEKIDQKLESRQQQLDEAMEFLKSANERISNMKEEHRRWQNILNDDAQIKVLVVEHNLFSTFIRMMQESFDPVKPMLSREQKKVLEESGFMDLADDDRSILELAGYLVMGYIAEATHYVNSHGGSSSNLSGWGRKKDEDDEQWWRRSIRQAASSLRPVRKIGRRR